MLPAGDAALVVEFPQRIDASRQRAVRGARGDDCVERVGAAVRDAVVGYCSVTVYFDPLRRDARVARGARCSTPRPPATDDGAAPAADVDVPVCYGGEFGPDLDDVAALRRAARRRTSSRMHAAATYRVYHGRIRSRLRLHGGGGRADRRAAPSDAAHRVPAGSVAIAGGQTGIYPDGDARRLEHHRPHAAEAVRSGSRRSRSCSKPGDRVRFRHLRADFARLSSES